MDETEEMPEMEKGMSNEIWVLDFTRPTAQAFGARVRSISERSPETPILIYINSDGGEVYSLISMMSSMDSVPNKIITVNMGASFSCAASLLAHGDIRFAAPLSRTMVHEIQGGAVGHIEDIKGNTDEMLKVADSFMSVLAEDCKIKGGMAAIRKKLKNMTGRDMYMNADEAKSFGIVDFVGVPQLQIAQEVRLVSAKKKKRGQQ